MATKNTKTPPPRNAAPKSPPLPGAVGNRFAPPATVDAASLRSFARTGSLIPVTALGEAGATHYGHVVSVSERVSHPRLEDKESKVTNIVNLSHPEAGSFSVRMTGPVEQTLNGALGLNGNAVAADYNSKLQETPIALSFAGKGRNGDGDRARHIIEVLAEFLPVGEAAAE